MTTSTTKQGIKFTISFAKEMVSRSTVIRELDNLYTKKEGAPSEN